MSSLNQSLFFSPKHKTRVRRTPDFTGPQKKGTVFKNRIITPRKPNSAKRKVSQIRWKVKTGLFDFKARKVYCKVPGLDISLSKLHIHATVLVQGGNTSDLPQVKHKLVRGVRGYDLGPLSFRRTRLSKYGCKSRGDIKKRFIDPILLGDHLQELYKYYKFWSNVYGFFYSRFSKHFLSPMSFCFTTTRLSICFSLFSYYLCALSL